MLSEEEVERAARVLASEARSPATVILFGSYAQGEADRHSDLDFLVVEEDVPDRIGEAARLRRALPQLGVPVDVLVMERGEAERRRRWPGNVVKFAFNEGRVLAQS